MMRLRTFIPAQCELRLESVQFQHDDARSCEVFTLQYWHSPATDTPSVPAPSRPGRILLVHGFRGDHHGMEAIARALPGYEVITVDLPGFGASAPVIDTDGLLLRHDAGLYAQVLECFAEALELGENDLILGHSFGSLVVAIHAAHSRRNWAGVCLLAPVTAELDSVMKEPGAAAVDAFYRAGALLPERLTRRIYDAAAVQRVMNLTMIESQDPATRAYARDQHRQYFNGYASTATLFDAYHSSVTDRIWDYTGRIGAPVLVIAGTADPLSSPAQWQQLYTSLATAELHIIAGTGHLVHYEMPEQIGHSISEFFSGLTTRERWPISEGPSQLRLHRADQLSHHRKE